MKNQMPESKILIVSPLILGIASLLSFALYYYSVNHAGSFIGVIFLGPILSSIGVIISILTRRSRKAHPSLWGWGLLTCLFGFIVCVLVIIILIMIMAAAVNGTWH